MKEKHNYILGTDNEELERLGFQHRVWADAAHALWHKAGFKAGQRIADIGCGPGFASFDLAEIVGREGLVHGIDKSEDYIRFARQKALALNHSNSLFKAAEFTDMELRAEYYDAVYTRWVFSWITSPEKLIAKVAGALKPGGVIAVQEYINWGSFKIYPEHPAVKTMIDACRQSWRDMESEIDIGKDLPIMFEKAGLKIVHMAPLERIARVGSLTWQWPTTFLRIYARQLINAGLLTDEQLENYQRVLPQIEQEKHAFLITPLMIEIIAEKI